MAVKMEKSGLQYTIYESSPHEYIYYLYFQKDKRIKTTFSIDNEIEVEMLRDGTIKRIIIPQKTFEKRKIKLDIACLPIELDISGNLYISLQQNCKKDKKIKAQCLIDVDNNNEVVGLEIL
jgi:uncharacterized protein YuzE